MYKILASESIFKYNFLSLNIIFLNYFAIFRKQNIKIILSFSINKLGVMPKDELLCNESSMGIPVESIYDLMLFNMKKYQGLVQRIKNNKNNDMIRGSKGMIMLHHALLVCFRNSLF